MFIFDRCHCSRAVVAPVKYKCDSNNLRGTFCKIEKSAYEEINERRFSNPHPDLDCTFVFAQLKAALC